MGDIPEIFIVLSISYRTGSACAILIVSIMWSKWRPLGLLEREKGRPQFGSGKDGPCTLLCSAMMVYYVDSRYKHREKGSIGKWCRRAFIH
jgi:hypothetical protein